MEPSQPQSQQRSRTPQLLVSLLLLCLALALVYFRQAMYDHYMFWSFKPSAEIVRLADVTTMTDEGRFYLYTSHAQVDERDAFNTDCNNTVSEETIVLGCYTGQRIYVFDVTDPKLDGIKEVTTAHEMLHAAYQRLSATEKTHVDDLINQQLKSVTDPHIQKLIDVYAKTEPGEKLNELHSIFGTELGSLNPELEQYYKQYFSDRQSVVKLAANYQSVFDSLQSKQTALLNTLKALAVVINKEETIYTADAADLNRDITVFNAKAKNGEMSSAEFSSARSALQARQTSLRQQYNKITSDIASYNQKRQDLQSINTQADALNHSIDSTLSPVPSL